MAAYNHDNGLQALESDVRFGAKTNSPRNSSDASWPAEARSRSDHGALSCALHIKIFLPKRGAATTVKGPETG